MVGGVHGDEPSGPTAIERILAADLDYRRPVAFVIANEEALSAGQRFVDEDLNRAFPGDPDDPTHESRLAARLTDLLADLETLSMHSTQSYGNPFAIVREVDGFVRQVVPHLSVEAVVDVGEFDGGRLFDSVRDLVEIECGFQGSEEAADNAEAIVREYLAVTGAIDATPRRARELPLYRLTTSIPKTAAPEYEVFASNFERVAEGERFAAAGGEPVRADDEFYPVLLSAEGYEERFGYGATYVGTVG